jgi:phosphoglycolate phosphatase-like HAD superfamily hydrolase
MKVLRKNENEIESNGILIVAFDMDGTIVDSEATKLSTFASLFVGCSAYEEIVEYNTANRGVPRRVKFEYICQYLVISEDVDQQVDTYLHQYQTSLSTSLNQCKLVKGFRKFIEQLSCQKYVISSAPLGEIEGHLKRLEIIGMFDDIFGFPITKVEALTSLSRNNEKVMYFGDALADYKASEESGADFIGVQSVINPNVFGEREITTIKDFSNTEEINNLLHRIQHNNSVHTDTLTSTSV